MTTFKKSCRPDKTKNVIIRVTVLEILWRTKADLKDGLSTQEVLPFFQKHKLKLLIYDALYNLIFKYDQTHPTSTTPNASA